MKRFYRSLGSITLGWLIGSCGGGDVVGPPPPPTVATVALSTDTATLVPAATVQLSATAKSASGEALQRSFSWTSSDVAKVTVSSSGMVVGVAPGAATITAAVDGRSATATITVLDGGVVSSAGGTLNVESGAVQIVVPADALASNTNLSVAASTAFANDARVITGTPFEFGPTGTNFAKPVFLKIKYDAANLPSGTEEAALELYLRTSAGWQAVPGSIVDLTAKVVSAQVSHFSTYAILTPEAVAAITISGPAEKLIVNGASSLVVGESEQLTATLTAGDGHVLSNRVVTWSSSDATIASISSTGLLAAVKPGSTTIVASAGGKTGSVVITVTPIPVATVTVTPTPASVVVGGTQQLTATLRDANNNVLTDRMVTWSSSNTATATVDANGLVTGVAAGGPVTITATGETKTGTSLITVALAPVVTVTLSAPTTPMVVGGTQALTAVTKDVNGGLLSGRTVSWGSSNTAVLTVSPASSTSGTTTVTATGVGTATITATSESVISTPTPTITVDPVPVATVTVNPLSASLVLGITPTQQMTATLTDNNGNVLTGRTVTWSSSNGAVATVSATGLVTGVAAGGPATITATSEAKTGTSSITVTLAPVNTVTLSAPTTPMVAGGTQVLIATPKDASNNALTGRTVSWHSSNTAVLTVSVASSVSTSSSATVTVTAMDEGTATISATSESAPSATTPVITVNPVPVAMVTVSPPSASLVLGVTPTQQLTAVTKDASGFVLTGRLVTWTSSNPAAATVDGNGLVTAVAAGGATITATSETKTGTSSITVTLAPVNTVTVTPSSASLVVGVTPTQQLTATLRDAAGNVLTGRVVTWSSSNPSAATVDLNGLVTAAGAGGTTITATSETKTGASSISVTLAPVNTVTVTPATASLVLGITPTQQLTATLRDTANNLLIGRVVAWTSSNPAAATVDGNGLVTAVGAGGTTITATSETKTGTSSITVALAPVATVTLSAPTTPIVVGGTQVLTATLKDADNNTLTGRTVSWLSSNTSVLTMSPASSTNGTTTVTAVGVGTATITAMSESVSSLPTPVITVNPAPVATVTVSPSSLSVVVGGTQQLTALLEDANNNVLTARAVTWSSSNAAQATVDANGLVTGVAAGGPVTITATSETKTGTSSITVTLAPVATVTLSPAAASMVLGVTPTQQLTATLRDAASNVLTGRTVTWTSSDPATATVSATGLVTAVAVGGPVTITATSETKTGTSSIAVTLAPVNTVTVSPATASLVVGIAPTQQLTATLRDAADNLLANRVVAWTSSNPSAATVDGSGLVTAVGAGGTTITATSETKTGTSSITVTLAPVATVTVTPATASLVMGITPTQQLTAVTKDVNGNVLTGRVVTWTSSDPAAATVDANGLVTGLAAGGPVTITATSETKTGRSSITVTLAPVATVTLSAPTTPMVVGGTQVLAATLKDADNNTLTGRTVSWLSSNTSVLTVSPANGTSGTTTVTAVGVGTATITATSESVSSTPTPAITVDPVPVATVTVTPTSASVVVGGTQQLSAQLKDSNGNVLTGRVVTWSSSNTATATVDANGLVTGVAAGGPVTITATSETKTGTSSIAVTLAPVNTVTVSPASASLVVGVTPTQQLTATLTDVNNNVLTGRVVTWSSSNPSTATVDGSGLVTAVGAGGTTITATSETKTGTASITVTLAPVATVTLSAPTTLMMVGETQLLTAAPKDVNNNILSGRTVGWVSSNPLVLSVSVASSVSTSSGATVTVTAMDQGTATISAASESAPSATTPLITVNPVPVATVTVTPETVSLVIGVTTTQQVTAVTKDANGIVLTARLVTWTSSNPAAATVDGNGLVTAVAAGGTTITATSETKTGTSSVTVTLAPVVTVTLSAPTTPMIVGETQVLTAVTKDVNGNVLAGRTVNWVSSNTVALTVSPASSTSGTTTVTATGVGTATITATSESVSSTPTPVITVNPVPVNAVTVSPTSVSLAPGGTQQLSAVTKDASGNVLTGRTITWSSDNSAVATVSTTGLVTGVAAGGPATITATSEGKNGTSSITVTAAAFTLRASPFITSGLNVPLFLTQPLNDGRIFIVEQPGRIRVVQDGILQTTPFLDISTKLIYAGEQGLLSVAFHPQYATNHYFYVYFTGLSGEIRIERFTTTSDPSVADPASEKLIFTTRHDPNANHYGGLVAFGPEGMLYAAFGDGGGTGDPAGNAQNFDAYLGGMIRIDIDNGDPYSVPADNPFVGQANKKPELWAKGLRNPWRYAFDAPTGLLFIADVGQSTREEVDVASTMQGGLNYGWNIMEGSTCYNATTCDQTGLQLPVLDYATHVAGTCSVIGGYVYHGSAMPAIQGHYFYSDYCAGWVRSFRYQNGAAVDQKDWGYFFTPVTTTSFGRDAAGELYVMSANSVYKLIPGP